MSNALRKKTRKLEPKNYEDKFTMQRIARHISAMERQNPIAAIAEKEDTGTTRYICPTCGMYMGWSTGMFPARYCWKCGQKLDWGCKE